MTPPALSVVCDGCDTPTRHWRTVEDQWLCTGCADPTHHMEAVGHRIGYPGGEMKIGPASAGNTRSPGPNH